MTDFLETKRKEITDRLEELKPLVSEYDLLTAAAAALDDLPASPNGVPAASRRPARRRRGPSRPRKRTGARAAQALKLIAAEPGITIPALGEKMSIKGNYLYTVVPSLERAGKVRKDGRGWYPKEAPASA